uniref:Serpentine receptor class gamma n=1 Tax=Meloidogyne incognita TaxID=6306 RepID=A0A914NBR2_MELIC
MFRKKITAKNLKIIKFNLLNYLIVFFFYNLPVFDPLAPLFDYFPSGYLIGIIDFIVFYTAYQQDILYTSICLNRFTAVWEPFKQQTRWKKWWIWHVLFAHIVPLPLTIHMLFSRGLYVPLDRYNPGIEKVPILLYYDLWEIESLIYEVFKLDRLGSYLIWGSSRTQ